MSADAADAADDAEDWTLSEAQLKMLVLADAEPGLRLWECHQTRCRVLVKEPPAHLMLPYLYCRGHGGHS